MLGYSWFSCLLHEVQCLLLTSELHLRSPSCWCQAKTRQAGLTCNKARWRQFPEILCSSFAKPSLPLLHGCRCSVSAKWVPCWRFRACQRRQGLLGNASRGPTARSADYCTQSYLCFGACRRTPFKCVQAGFGGPNPNSVFKHHAQPAPVIDDNPWKAAGFPALSAV